MGCTQSSTKETVRVTAVRLEKWNKDITILPTIFYVIHRCHCTRYITQVVL